MNLAHDLIVDPLPPTIEPDKHLATWYTQGHSDGLGDRLLMFDNTSAPSWEILRFNPAIALVPEFGEALRERVERLRSFRHPAFPVVRAIEELGREDGLAVASTYSSGVRLSDALKRPRSAAFAVRIIRQLAPALSALQRHAQYMAHGALTADRIVITGEGRLTIREHMVGSALESLGLSAAKLWSHFGILAPEAGEALVPLTARNDVVQVGLVALSLLAGCRIGPETYPEKIDELLDSIAERNGQPAVFESLRRWLERAVLAGPDAFECARDANEALAELRDDTAWGDDQLFARGGVLRDTSEAPAPGPRLIASRAIIASDSEPSPAPALAEASPMDGRPRALPASGSTHAEVRLGVRGLTWAAIGIAALVVGEGLFIVRGRTARATGTAPAPTAVSIDSPEPGAQVWVDDQLVGATPLQLKVDSRVRSIRVLPPPVKNAPEAAAPSVTPPPPPAESRAAQNARLPISAPKSGGFRLTAPVQLYVLDGERVLGSSSDGPILSTAGRHEFEFVNTAIGYRMRKSVEIKPGQVAALAIEVPNGTLNINAAPWASVWVDGTPVGDTPIGNLSIAPGQHEIVFRHPQLGERREKTIVRADGPTRVTANLQR